MMTTYEVTIQRPDGRQQARTVDAEDAQAAEDAVATDLEAERPPAATIVEVRAV
jgi:hypothetical protein